MLVTKDGFQELCEVMNKCFLNSPVCRISGLMHSGNSSYWQDTIIFHDHFVKQWDISIYFLDYIHTKCLVALDIVFPRVRVWRADHSILSNAEKLPNWNKITGQQTKTASFCLRACEALSHVCQSAHKSIQHKTSMPNGTSPSNSILPLQLLFATTYSLL